MDKHIENLNKVLDTYYSRFRTLMEKVISGNKTVILTDDLPDEVLRKNNLDDNRFAIHQIDYLLTVLEVGPIYPFILSLIFPKALLCGFIDFAYEVEAYSEFLHKKIDIGNRTLFGVLPWRETKGRKDLEELIKGLKPIDNIWYEIEKNCNYSIFSSLGEEEEDKLWDEYEKNSEKNKEIYETNSKILDSINKLIDGIADRCGQFVDIEFALTRVNHLISLFDELREKSIIID